jgi:hypothetical protein
MEKFPLHIKFPDLQTSPEVEDAVEKRERLSMNENGHSEKVPNDPKDRIEAYMDRLEHIFINKDARVRERNIDMLHDRIYGAFIIKRKDVPESFFDLQKRVARERGQPVETIPPDMREKMIDTIIEDQKASLDSWIDYLTSDDAVYPTWYKYFVFRNVVKLSQFDKELGKFKARTDTTTAPFPDIYREPLAQIADLYEQYPVMLKEIQPKLQKLRQEKTELQKQLKGADEEGRRKLENEIFAINQQVEDISAPMRDFNEKFPTLYAKLIQESLAASMENKEETKGEWVKFDHGDPAAAERLFHSLEGKGTGWCTAGKSTAKTQIDSGDFYVYYTYDASGIPTQPRIAIRMEESRIAEIRGILPHQSLEPAMGDILEKKLAEFGPEADTYKKKSGDMRLLTEIDKKSQSGQSLSRDELVFLYEIDASIEGFGYEKDPRVVEIREERSDQQEVFHDMQVIFDCSPEDIAQNPEDVRETTRAYIGPLFPDIFQKNIEHIFTSFPEGKIQSYRTEIGGITKEQLEQQLIEKKIYISDWAKDILHSRDFTTQSSPETADLIRLTVEDLGFENGATTAEIYKKAEEFGLELCPAEVGPHLRLSYTGGDWMYIAMKQISDRDGYPDVLYLCRGGAGLQLYAFDARPSSRSYGDDRFVFRFRKKL